MCVDVLLPLAPWEPDEFISNSLGSIGGQTWRPLALLVSVDGKISPEQREIILNFEVRSGVSARIIEGPGNEGVGLVLARALPFCTSEFVARMDADDVSSSLRLERQMGVILSDSKLVVVGSFIEEFTSDMKTRLSARRVPVGGSVGRWIPYRNPVNHQTALFRRQEILEVGGYRHCPGFEDFDLWLRVIRRFGASAVTNVPEFLVRARTGPAHSRRRLGRDYAKSEVSFYLQAIEAKLIKRWAGYVALALRLPVRLLSPRMYAYTVSAMRGILK